MDDTRFKLHYRGSLFWLIFWLIIFFPIALVLLLTGSSFKYNQETYHLNYGGSLFWLCFWLLLFFPVAFVLLLVNGLSVIVQKENSGSTVFAEESPFKQ